MSAFNTNWPRWIKASLTKHFESYKGDLTFILEDVPMDVADPRERVEFRTDGPDFSEPSDGWWIGRVVVNLLLVLQISKSDAYRVERFIGQMQAAFIHVCIKKYGSAGGDDGTHVGTMYVSPARYPKIAVDRFGQLDPNIKLDYTTLEAEYLIEIAL